MENPNSNPLAAGGETNSASSSSAGQTIGKSRRPESFPSPGFGGARDDECYQPRASYYGEASENMQRSRLVEGLALTDHELVEPQNNDEELLRRLRRQQAEATQQIRDGAEALRPAVGIMLTSIVTKGCELVADAVKAYFTQYHEPPTFYGTRMMEEQPDFSFALSPQAVAEMYKQRVLVAPRTRAPLYGLVANFLGFAPIVGTTLAALRAWERCRGGVLRGALILTTLGMNVSHLAVHGTLALAQLATAGVLAMKRNPLWVEFAVSGVVNSVTLINRTIGCSDQDLHLAMYYGRELEAGEPSMLDNRGEVIRSGNREVLVVVGRPVFGRNGKRVGIVPQLELYTGSGAVQTRMFKELLVPNVLSHSPATQSYVSAAAAWANKSRITNSYIHADDPTCGPRTLMLLAIAQRNLYDPSSGGYAVTPFTYGDEAYRIPLYKKTDLGVSVAKAGARVEIESVVKTDCASKPMAYVPKCMSIDPTLPKRPVMHMSGGYKGDRGSFLSASNAVSSLSRIISKAPQIDSSKLKLLQQFAALFLGRRLWATPIGEGPDMLRYIDNSNYSADVKARLRELHGQICLIQSITDLPARALAWQAFLKKERVSERGKAARNICGISDYMRVLTLCCLDCVYPQIDEMFPEMCCGATPQQLFRQMQRMFDLNGLFIEGDFSIFDSSQITAITKHVDELAIRTIFANHPFFMHILLSSYASPDMKIMLGEFMTIWCELMRASGSAFTYVFNTFVNIVVTYFALCLAGEKVPVTPNQYIAFVDGKFQVLQGHVCVPLIAGGDDSLTQLESMRTGSVESERLAVGQKVEAIAANYAALGFSMKFPKGDNGEIELKPFTSSAFLQRTYTMEGEAVAEPIKRLVDLPYLWMEHKTRGGSRQEEYETELIRAKLMSALYNWPGCPIIAPFFQKLLNKLGALDTELLLRRHAQISDRYTQAHFESLVRASEAPLHQQPSDRQRESVAELYGIPPVLQILAEQCESYDEIMNLLRPYVPPDWVEFGITGQYMVIPAGEPTDNKTVNDALTAPAGTKTVLYMVGTEVSKDPPAPAETPEPALKPTVMKPKDETPCKFGDLCTRRNSKRGCPFQHETTAPSGAQPTKAETGGNSAAGSNPAAPESGKSQRPRRSSEKPRVPSGKGKAVQGERKEQQTAQKLAPKKPAPARSSKPRPEEPVGDRKDKGKTDVRKQTKK